MDDNNLTRLEDTFEALAKTREQFSNNVIPTLMEWQNCFESLRALIAGVFNTVQACRDSLTPVIQNIRAAYPAMMKMATDFGNIYINVARLIAENIPIQNMMSGLDAPSIQSIFSILEENNDELSDINIDTASALYAEGKITDEDIAEEVGEMVSIKDYALSVAGNIFKKTVRFLAVQFLTFLLTLPFVPAIERIKDDALEAWKINELWEDSIVYEIADKVFGIKSGAVSEQEAKDTVSEENVGNISKKKREDLLQKIQAIRDYISAAPQDENTGNLLAYLSEFEKDVNGKKYGLVFEEYREEIDEVLDTHTPVLTEEKGLFIDNGGQMNFLIEGDNLAALKLLEKTHRGKIDLIYIDPPYNRGKADFIYNDDYVVYEDTFKHSKWISFIKARLEVAKRILSENGLVFISIDDNEVSTLKLLCDKVFGTDYFINIFVWQRN